MGLAGLYQFMWYFFCLETVGHLVNGLPLSCFLMLDSVGGALGYRKHGFRLNKD